MGKMEQKTHMPPGIRGGVIRPASLPSYSAHSAYSQLVADWASGELAPTRTLEEQDDPEQSDTTVMIRHIACRYTPEKVRGILDEAGLKGKYTFLHLPMNPRKRAN